MSSSSDPKKALTKQGSLSCIEQSLSMMTSPQQAPVMIYPGPKSAFNQLSKVDLEIADRLSKLKQKNVDAPSVEDVASRLAQLKGLPKDYYSKPSVYHAPNQKTNVEKADDLISQALNECALESKLAKPEDEIEARLKKLRSKNACEPLKENSPDEEPSQLSSIEDGDLDKLLQLANTAQAEAMSEVENLSKDKELEDAIEKICREAKEKSKLKKEKKKNKKKSEDCAEERFSASDEDFGGDKKVDDNEKAEVDRIVEMYVEKEKRRKLRKANKKKGEEPSSESELSSGGNDTSESEKWSCDSD